MRQLSEVGRERESLSTVVELTSAFEGIASMHITQIKDQVLTSQHFFDELWRIYSQIRVDKQFHFGRRMAGGPAINKDLIIVVTAEGSFSGDIDERVVKGALKGYDPTKHDIVVVGHHGATQLAQAGIRVVQNFKLPSTDRNINVWPLVALVQRYIQTVVFYPTYISLMNQEVKNIQMSALVAEKGEGVAEGPDIISETTYIFEPSTHAVVDHLERSMLVIMLSQIILESKLAQYASRFQAMHIARDKAEETHADLSTSFNRLKRLIKDERSKEIINGLRGAKL